MKIEEYNSLALAYLGDSVYEIYIREYLIKKGIQKVNQLQKDAVKYVSAKAQCEFLKTFIKNNQLTEEELTVIYRARNHKNGRHPKNTDIETYKYSTGFEALIGYLYLKNNKNRIDELMNLIIGE